MAEYRRDNHYAVGFELHNEHGEDQIDSGSYNNGFSYVFVADGVSLSYDPEQDKNVLGLGGFASERAKVVTQRIVNNELRRMNRVSQMLQRLHDLPGTVAGSLEKGNTTLQLALLAPMEDDWYWFYTYVGDGAIWKINPQKRTLSPTIVPEFILNYPKFRFAPALGRGIVNFAPNTGCQVYEPGDMLFVSSDGLNLRTLNQWTISNYNLDMTEFFATYAKDPAHLKRELNKFTNYHDDAVLGYIF